MSQRRKAADDRKKLRLDLEPNEVKALVKACTRYRASLPAYLQVNLAELEIVDGILRKLEG